MHCRKVRSFLSAFSNEEMTGRVQLAVCEHLSTCSACRAEEGRYNSLKHAVSELPRTNLSRDFNTQLLNRIGHEQFAETRTKAYMPRLAPRFAWRSLVPVTVSALGVAVVFVGLFGGETFSGWKSSTEGFKLGQNDAYITAEPTFNPNMAKDWSLDKSMAQNERLSALTNGLILQSGFSGQSLTSGYGGYSVYDNSRAPYIMKTYRLQPVYRIYHFSGNSHSRGVGSEF